MFDYRSYIEEFNILGVQTSDTLLCVKEATHWFVKFLSCVANENLGRSTLYQQYSDTITDHSIISRDFTTLI